MVAAEFKLIYLDTCIYLNLLLDETSGWFNPAEIALGIFKRAMDGEFKIIISDVVITQIKNKLSASKQDSYKELILDLEKAKTLVWVYSKKDDWGQARQISKIHVEDSLHGILAKRAGAEVIVTSNYPDFSEVHEVLKIKIRPPESI